MHDILFAPLLYLKMMGERVQECGEVLIDFTTKSITEQAAQPFTSASSTKKDNNVLFASSTDLDLVVSNIRKDMLSKAMTKEEFISLLHKIDSFLINFEYSIEHALDDADHELSTMQVAIEDLHYQGNVNASNRLYSSSWRFGPTPTLVESSVLLAPLQEWSAFFKRWQTDREAQLNLRNTKRQTRIALMKTKIEASRSRGAMLGFWVLAMLFGCVGLRQVRAVNG